MSFEEILYRSVNTCKNTEKRKDNCKNRLFKTKPFIELNPQKSHNSNDNHHLKGQS